MVDLYFSSRSVLSGWGRISKYYHLLIDFCVPVYYASKHGSVTVHAQDSKILDPWRHELPRRLGAGDLSKDAAHSIYNFIFKNIKFSKNENNQHSDVWLTEKQRNQNKFPDYIDESDYELLNEFKTHRGIWGNYPTEYYDYFRDHINSLISPPDNPEQITIIKRDPNSSSTSRDRGNLERVEEIYNSYADENVKLVDFADLSFVEQIKTCQNTKLLIGEHGAGLSNAVFMKPGSEVHEFGNVRLPCFRILAKQCQLKYKIID